MIHSTPVNAAYGVVTGKSLLPTTPNGDQYQEQNRALALLSVVVAGRTPTSGGVSNTVVALHKNANDAIGNFTIYAIKVGKEIWKVGKADSDRTRPNGTPERVAQQIQRLKKHLENKFDVTWVSLKTLKDATTQYAKEVEKGLIQSLKSPQKSTERSKLK
jgi:hypothetical protein